MRRVNGARTLLSCFRQHGLSIGLGAAVLLLMGCKREQQAEPQQAQSEQTTRLERAQPEPPEPPPPRAQPQGQQPAGSPPAAAPGAGAAREGGEISDDEFEQFARAVVATQPLQAQFQAAMTEAKNQEQAQEIQRSGAAAMKQAVEETGLSFEEYVRLGKQMEHAPALRMRLQQRLQELQR